MRVSKFFKTILFLLMFTILWSCEIRRFFDIPISEEERKLFDKIEAETGFMIDSTVLDRRAYTRRYHNDFFYNVEFYQENDFNNKSILSKKCMDFYNLLKKDSILSKLSRNRDEIGMCIEYRRKEGKYSSPYCTYVIEIQKDRKYYYNTDRKDTVFIKETK